MVRVDNLGLDPFEVNWKTLNFSEHLSGEPRPPHTWSAGIARDLGNSGSIHTDIL